MGVWWRGGKGKESLQLRLWNLNGCIQKVNVECWLVEMILVMMSLPLACVFFNVCLHSCSFLLCADWWKSDSSADGEPREFGSGIKVPECPGELARKLTYKRIKTMGNYKTVRPKKWSQLLMRGSCLGDALNYRALTGKILASDNSLCHRQNSG